VGRALECYEASLAISRELGTATARPHPQQIGHVYGQQAVAGAQTLRGQPGDQPELAPPRRGHTLHNIGQVYGSKPAGPRRCNPSSQPGDQRSWGPPRREHTLHNIGTLLRRSVAGGVGTLEASLAISRELGDPRRRPSPPNIGHSQDLGRGPRPGCTRPAVAISRSCGDRHSEGQTLNKIGQVHGQQARWGQRSTLQASLAISRELGPRAKASSSQCKASCTANRDKQGSSSSLARCLGRASS